MQVCVFKGYPKWFWIITFTSATICYHKNYNIYTEAICKLLAYRSNIPVQCTFVFLMLQAFDRVNHAILCKKLVNCNLPNIIVHIILHVWFSRQCFYVKRQSVLSHSFHATNDVRQGEFLSPHLFNVHINELSLKHNSQFTGCHISSIWYNHPIHADDTVHLAPSPKASHS